MPDYTQGPWEIFVGGNFVRVGAIGYKRWTEEHRYLGGPLCVAEMQYAATETYDTDPQKALANARLIAAAPDLLEALKLRGAETEDGTLCFCGLYGLYGEHTNSCEKARAAIDKAEGR